MLNSRQTLITIVQSVTSVSVQVRTATAVHTATVVPTLLNSNGNSNNKQKKSSGISGGAIAGIVIGVVAGVLIIGGMLLWLLGVPLLCIPARRRQDDDEKSIRDDDSLAYANPHDAAIAGVAGYGRTPGYLLSPDQLSIGYGNRRFSASSLPDAANGSHSESDSSKGGGLRVINPDQLSEADLDSMR